MTAVDPFGGDVGPYRRPWVRRGAIALLFVAYVAAGPIGVVVVALAVSTTATVYGIAEDVITSVARRRL